VHYYIVSYMDGASLTIWTHGRYVLFIHIILLLKQLNAIRQARADGQTGVNGLLVQYLFTIIINMLLYGL